MPHMAEIQPAPRLSESLPGRLAGWLLAVLWIFSMTGVDAHAFSSYPVCLGMAGVLALVAVGLLAGHRVVRMSAMGWVSLLIGGYFLLRCLHSYAVVDSWCEAVLILGGMLYYVAGVYVAQNQRFSSLMVVLAAAVLLNLLAFYAVRQPWFCLEWTGRASQTPAGANSVPSTLFVYKNFSGVFLCLCGSVLAAWGLWMSRGVSRVLFLLLGAVSVLVSFFCETRAVYLVLPLCVVLLWGADTLLRVSAGKKLTSFSIVFGAVLVIAAGVAGYEFLFGHHLAGYISEADSHLRYLIWEAVCEVLPSTPLWGCGANVAQWEMVPYYNEWQLPNYAHNEYLQAWVDYGIVGVSLVLLVLLMHVVQGLRCIISEHVTPLRRVVAALAVLVLAVVAVYAVVDFPWHSFAFVSMCAFVCGLLASPFAHARGSWWSSRKWAAGSHAAVVGVKAQRWPGRVLVLLLLLVVAGLSGWLGHKLRPAWHAQWQYNELCKSGADESGDARRAFIEGLMPHYPSPALADTYFLLPPARKSNLHERERILRLALAGNPRQLFMVTMLVDVLGAQKKYAEAEQLMREHYVREMPPAMLNNWPAYYAYNLLVWGRYDMQTGHHASALSKINYALAINKKYRMGFTPVYRSGLAPWKKQGGVKRFVQKLVETSRNDARILRYIGTRPDDSWMQPMSPGGRPALYRSVVDSAE